MKDKVQDKKKMFAAFGMMLVLWALEMAIFINVGLRPIVMACGLAIVAMLLLWDLKPLWNVSSILWLSYGAFAGLSAIWAMSGKFFLKEYIKLFLGLGVFLFVMLKPVMDRGFVCRVLLVIASMSAWIALLSVEMVSTGLVRHLMSFSAELDTLTLGFSGRLYGIYGNSNVEASVYAVGILAALAGLSAAREKRERILYAVFCSMSAFAFLLCISVGATVCFALAVVVYLIAAGKERVKVLLRMLIIAVPTVVFAAGSVSFFNAAGVAKCLPLVLMAVSVAVSVLLELRIMESFTGWMERHTKLPFLLLLVMVALIAAYLVAALNLTSAYTFSYEGEWLARADYTEVGPHTLEIEATGPVNVQINSLTRYNVLQGEYPVICSASDTGSIEFEVPENSIVCRYIFDAEPGVKITSVTIDGKTSLPLKYLILPNFVANRLQGAWASSSLVTRQALWDFGMRLFRMSPVIGNGYGAYECGLMRVEDFVYESKYVHNHYIQVLLETGVIGFALYLSAMVSMAVLLIKKRRFIENAELGWIYPLLASAFVMMATVTLWDISMSRAIYTGMIFAVFALLTRLLATPLPMRQTELEKVTKKEREALAEKQRTREWLLHGACVLLPALFLVTLGCNMVANSLLNKPVASYNAFFANVERAAHIDPYEYNDAKLSYILAVVDCEDEAYLDQANVFAEELLQVQSNSIPYYLEQYYIATRQYAKALEAAQRSAVYSAASPDTWNNSFNALWNGVILNDDALASDFDTLLPLLLAYKDSFDQRNAAAIAPIALEEPAASAYDLLTELGRLDQQDRQDAVDYLDGVLADYHAAIAEYQASLEESGD